MYQANEDKVFSRSLQLLPVRSSYSETFAQCEESYI